MGDGRRFFPKRVSIWEVKTGKLLDEKFGPCYVSTPITMDPADPTRAYCQNVEWKVDLDKGTWRPQAVMFEARPDAPYFWPHMVLNIVFTAKNGKQYMMREYRAAGAGSFLWVRRGDRFVAVAGIISPFATLSWRHRRQRAGRKPRKCPGSSGKTATATASSSRTKRVKRNLRALNPHAIVDADLNFYCTGMYNELYWQRISPKQILPQRRAALR